MSNIFFNCLTVRGSTKGVADFKERNQGTMTDAHGKRVKCPLLFNALVPYPTDLNLPYGGYAQSLYHVLYSSDEEMLADSGVQRAGLKVRRALAAYFKKKEPDAARLARQYRTNIEKYGHATFFTWYPDKWGPNHDLGDGKEWDLSIEQPSTKELIYSFDTNWGVPDGWLMTVAKLFPKLEFTLAWECPDSETTGLILYRNGKQKQFVERGVWLIGDGGPYDLQGSYISNPEGPPAAPKVKPTRRRVRKAASKKPRSKSKKVPLARRAATTQSKKEKRSPKDVRRRNK